MAELGLHHHVWLPRGGAARTVVALHGTGGDELDLVPLAERIYPGANILGIRGNVNEHGAARFFKRMGEGVFDEADIRARAEELVAFFAAAKSAYGMPDEVVWMGYSNGANMIAAMLLLNDVVQDGLLLRAQAPFKDGAFGRTAVRATVRIHSGEQDGIVPLAEAVRLRAQLEGRGHSVEHVRLNAGHQLVSADLAALS